MTFWRTDLQSSRPLVVIDGVIEHPIDGGDDPVPFRADFHAIMLDGIRDYIAGYQPWDLLVSADGDFERDGGRCSIEALRFGWCKASEFTSEAVEIVALVRHCDHLDVTANEPQPLARFVSSDIQDLQRLLAGPLPAR